MNALLGLQGRFQGFLMADETAIVEDVTGNEHIDPRRRLGIYYDAYRSRLVEALTTDYTALQRQMGEEAFEQAALRFIQATPSVHRNLRWYGQSLPAFLRATSPYDLTPWLADVAQFEWSITLAFDAADQDSLSFDQVAALDPAAWPTARFGFHPSLQRLGLGSNAPVLRKAADEEQPPPAPELSGEPAQWMLWRKELLVLYRSLAVDEAWALDAACEGSDFTRLCEGLCEWVEPDQAAARLAGLLRTWVDEGLIVSVDA